MDDKHSPLYSSMESEKVEMSLFNENLENASSNGIYLLLCKSYIDVNAIPNLKIPILHMLLKDEMNSHAEVIAFGDEAQQLNIDLIEYEVYFFKQIHWDLKKSKERICWKDTERLIGHFKAESGHESRKNKYSEVMNNISDLNKKNTIFTSAEVEEHFSRFIVQFMVNHATVNFTNDKGFGTRRVSEFITSDGVPVFLTGFGENTEFTDDLEVGEFYEIEGALHSIDDYTREGRINLSYTCFSSFNKIKEQGGVQIPTTKISLKSDFSNMDGTRVEIEVIARGCESLSSDKLFSIVGLDGSMTGKWSNAITIEFGASFGVQNHDILKVTGVVRRRGDKHTIIASKIEIKMEDVMSEEHLGVFKHPLKFV